MVQFLESQFQDTVSALIHAAAGVRGESEQPGLAPPYNDLTRFVLAQQARLPDYLQGPMLAATLVFDLCGIFQHGRPFHRLSIPARARQIEAWKRSRLGFQRDLIRYYESLGAFALHSRAVREVADQQALPGTALPGVITAPAADLRHAIVVVGSGPGGAITACLLAEAGRDVLLIEEGDYLGLDSCAPFTRDELMQKYRHGGQTVAMGANKIAYVEGRCVGGGSEINSGLYHRTPPEILEKWRREFQVQVLGENDLRPHFEACERDVSVSLLPGAAPAASLKLHEGAVRLGWKSLEVPRWFKHSNVPGALTQGKRQSMTETFVPRFLRAGGRLLPQTRVDRMRQEGGSWHLVARRGKSEIRIRAETLFICGGAVQTPALLRRNGITQNIGNSLHLHPTVKVVAQFPEAVNSADMGVPVHQVKEFSPRLSFGCSISNPPYLALGLLDHPDAKHNLTETWPHLTTYYAMITGAGGGTVRTLPGFRDPLVRYRLTTADRRDLADGLRKLSQALFEAGATRLYPGITGLLRLTARDELSKLPASLPSGRSNLMTIHLFSSCPMGENAALCATDSFGRVHGFKNLHIADASLLCTAPGVNPQGSIMALARRNALHFLENR